MADGLVDDGLALGIESCRKCRSREAPDTKHRIDSLTLTDQEATSAAKKQINVRALPIHLNWELRSIVSPRRGRAAHRSYRSDQGVLQPVPLPVERSSDLLRFDGSLRRTLGHKRQL